MLSKIKDAGIVGCGGAGFPTYAKLDCQVDYLIINAAECEPLLQTDKYIMRHFSMEFVSAAVHSAEQVGAKNLYIALKGHYEEEIHAIEDAIQKINCNAKVFLLKNYYPAGDEQMMVYEVTGRIVPPGGIPLMVGAVVSNVATMLAVHDALEGRTFTHKYLTVTGEVPNPCIVHAPIGTPLTECLKAAGTSMDPETLYILGGPMMGKNSLGMELEKEVVTKTTSGIIALTDQRWIASSALEPMKIINRARSACIQCRYCTDMCPRYLIGHPLEPHKIMRKLATNSNIVELLDDADIRNAAICCECGICEEYACPMGLMPRRINAMIKQELGKAGIRYQKPDTDCEVNPFREYRMIPTPGLVSRLGLKRYYGVHIDECIEVKASKVEILLKQHIGALSVPVVKAGDKVEVGQLIADSAANGLSVPMHSSISGIVDKVTDSSITIRSGRKKQ